MDDARLLAALNRLTEAIQSIATNNQPPSKDEGDTTVLAKSKTDAEKQLELLAEIKELLQKGQTPSFFDLLVANIKDIFEVLPKDKETNEYFQELNARVENIFQILKNNNGLPLYISNNFESMKRLIEGVLPAQTPAVIPEVNLSSSSIKILSDLIIDAEVEEISVTPITDNLISDSVKLLTDQILEASKEKTPDKQALLSFPNNTIPPIIPPVFDTPLSITPGPEPIPVILYGILDSVYDQIKEKLLKGEKTDNNTNAIKQILGGTANLINLGVGIAALAFAFLLFSEVTTSGIITGMIALAAAVSALYLAAKNISEKEVENIKHLSSSLLILGAAIAALSFGLILLENVSIGTILSFLILFAGTLTILNVAINQFNDKAKVNLTNISASFLKFATSAVIFSLALTLLQNVSFSALVMGLISVAGAVGILGVSLFLLQKYKLENTINNLETLGNVLIKISGSILIFTAAALLLENIPFSSIIKGLLLFGGVLGSLLLFLYTIEKTGIGKSITLIEQLSSSLIKLSLSVGILTFSLILLENIKWESIGKGIVILGGLIAGLLSLSLTTKIATPAVEIIEKLGKAALMLAGSTLILVAATLLLENVEWSAVIQALVLLGGAVIGLAVASYYASPGITALGFAVLMASGGVWILANAIESLTNISLGEFLGVLVGLTVALSAFAGLAILLTPVIPVMLGLGAALALLGATIFLVGKGFQAMVEGIAGFVELIPQLASINPLHFIKLSLALIVLTPGLLAISAALIAFNVATMGGGIDKFEQFLRVMGDSSSLLDGLSILSFLKLPFIAPILAISLIPIASTLLVFGAMVSENTLLNFETFLRVMGDSSSLLEGMNIMPFTKLALITPVLTLSLVPIASTLLVFGTMVSEKALLNLEIFLRIMGKSSSLLGGLSILPFLKLPFIAPVLAIFAPVLTLFGVIVSQSHLDKLGYLFDTINKLGGISFTEANIRLMTTGITQISKALSEFAINLAKFSIITTTKALEEFNSVVSSISTLFSYSNISPLIHIAAVLPELGSSLVSFSKVLLSIQKQSLKGSLLSIFGIEKDTSLNSIIKTIEQLSELPIDIAKITLVSSAIEKIANAIVKITELSNITQPLKQIVEAFKQFNKEMSVPLLLNVDVLFHKLQNYHKITQESSKAKQLKILNLNELDATPIIQTSFFTNVVNAIIAPWKAIYEKLSNSIPLIQNMIKPPHPLDTGNEWKLSYNEQPNTQVTKKNIQEEIRSIIASDSSINTSVETPNTISIQIDDGELKNVITNTQITTHNLLKQQLELIHKTNQILSNILAKESSIGNQIIPSVSNSKKYNLNQNITSSFRSEVLAQLY